MNRPAALTRTLLVCSVAAALLAGCVQQENAAATALDKLQERASTIRQLASEPNLSAALNEVDLLEADLEKAAVNGDIAAEMQQQAVRALAEVRSDLEVLAGKTAQPEVPQSPELPVPEETFTEDGDDWRNSEGNEDGDDWRNSEGNEDWDQWENDDDPDAWDDEDRDRWEDQHDEDWEQWEDERDEAWDQWEDQRDDSSDDGHR
jgi:hypothetical protein